MRKKYRIVGMPIVEVGARFILPCRFDDDIVVESEVGEWGRSSFTVRHRILKAGELALDGFEKRVWAAQILNAWARSKLKPFRRKSSRVSPIRLARQL